MSWTPRFPEENDHPSGWQTPAPSSSPKQNSVVSKGLSRAELVLQITEHHQTILHHLLFWLQDQVYHRLLWHRRLTEMLLFDAEVRLELGDLLIDLESVRAQFPYGYGPEDDGVARQLQGRLAILKYELEYLRCLCEAYLARTDAG